MIKEELLFRDVPLDDCRTLIKCQKIKYQQAEEVYRTADFNLELFKACLDRYFELKARKEQAK